MLPECRAAATSGPVTLTEGFLGVEGTCGTITAGLDRKVLGGLSSDQYSAIESR